MNSRYWPGYWQPPHPYANPYSNPYQNPNHNPNPTTISGQNSHQPPSYSYGYAPSPYGNPGWGYNPGQPQAPHWANSQHAGAIQTNSITPMMPPNVEAYQNNLQEEPYREVWESPQSPQSPWIRAYEQYENEEEK